MNIIHTGDCLLTLRAWADMGIKVQMCVTSPPYFGLRDYGHPGQIGLESSPDEFVSKLVAVFREVRRVLQDDGTCWVVIGDSYANDGKWGGHTGGKHAKVLHGSPVGKNKRYTGFKPKDLIGVPWMLAFALRADGWYLRQDIIWAKPNPMPESVTDRCTKAHEYIFLLSKSPRYLFNHEAIKDPSVGSKQRSVKRGDFDGKTNALHGRESFRAVTEMRNKRSVWTVSTKAYKGAHFATFPSDLIEPCILSGSRPGDIVLDPFMGSGTTAAVALRNGRQYLGCELKADYEHLQKQRLTS